MAVAVSVGFMVGVGVINLAITTVGFGIGSELIITVLLRRQARRTSAHKGVTSHFMDRIIGLGKLNVKVDFGS